MATGEMALGKLNTKALLRIQLQFAQAASKYPGHDPPPWVMTLTQAKLGCFCFLLLWPIEAGFYMAKVELALLAKSMPCIFHFQSSKLKLSNIGRVQS